MIYYLSVQEVLPMRKKLRFILLVIALLVFCLSTFHLAKDTWQTIKTAETSRNLSALIIDTETPPVVPTDKVVSKSDSEKMMEKYGKLYNRNNDFIGWLDIDGTDIHYPVMQSVAEPEKYLELNFDLQPDYAGTLFVDARCDLVPGHISTDTIIYGHHMKNGTMFGTLSRFEDPDFCRDHCIIRFDTVYRPGTSRLFAVIMSQVPEDDPSQEEDMYYNFINAKNESSLENYLKNIQQCSVYYDKSCEPHFGDEILTLSTCNYHTENGRLALIAVRNMP